MFVMTWDIFLMPVDPKTGEPLEEAHMLEYMPTGGNCCPRWSPDGKYLAFASKKKRSPRQANIVVVSADSGEAKEYPIPTENYRGFLTDLSWVPDGSGLGFSMMDPSESQSGHVRRLFRLNLETEEWETWRLPSRFGGTWGPDGSTFVFEKRGEEGEEQGIVQWNPYSGEERVLYRIPEDMEQRVVRGLTFSNDAKKLIFSLNNYVLMVLDVKTGKAEKAGVDFMSPAWSPNGNLILALDSWEEGWPKTMSVSPAEGGERTELELGGRLPIDCHLLKPHWSPSGDQIVFNTRYSIHEAFLLKNVLPKKQPK
jgi:Tol biopolymer transport system component